MVVRIKTHKIMAKLNNNLKKGKLFNHLQTKEKQQKTEKEEKEKTKNVEKKKMVKEERTNAQIGAIENVMIEK